MGLEDQTGSAYPRIVAVMRRLLSEKGCPWDREQTFETLRKYVVEEAHEVVDTLDALGEDAKHPVGPAREKGAQDSAVLALREELGDLLFQVIFQGELARSRGWFGPDDIVDGIADKMERRHPHVFGEVQVSGANEVLANWERNKAREKKEKGLLSGMPKGLPGLLYGLRLGEKAAQVGFDWPDVAGVREKLTEELQEFDEALAEKNREAIEHELGDLFFTLANLSRKLGIDPEAASRAANRRFETRFSAVETAAREQGKRLDELSLDELNELWEAAKKRTTKP